MQMQKEKMINPRLERELGSQGDLKGHGARGRNLKGTMTARRAQNQDQNPAKTDHGLPTRLVMDEAYRACPLAMSPSFRVFINLEVRL